MLIPRWHTAARVALFMIACAVVLAVVAPFSRKLTGAWPLVSTGAITSLATFALSALFTRWDRLRLRDVGTALTGGSALRLAAGFAAGLILAGLQAFMVWSMGHVRYQLPANPAAPAAPVVLLGYLLLACREELAFHGYPLRRLASLFGVLVAQLLIALVFAGEHALGGYSWSNALLGSATGSLLFGMAAIATRGLAVPIGLHAAWNFGQWVVGGKEMPGRWTVVVEPGFRDSVQQIGMMSYLIVFGLAICAFWFYHQRAARKHSR
jgi:membrane protease YdiL (CAAX protease family)